MDVNFSAMQNVSNSNSPTDVLRHSENINSNGSTNPNKNPLNYSQLAFANNNNNNNNNNSNNNNSHNGSSNSNNSTNSGD